MNKNILNSGVQNFITKNKHTDIVSVLFKKPIFDDVSNKELAEQIQARQKCEQKLPTWYQTENIYYPKKLNLEQTSSEITALYKSNLVKGKRLIDLTGGFGVDSYYFSKKFEEVKHFEIDSTLSEIASHNLKKLGATNIECYAENGMDALSKENLSGDCIFIDPSRRSKDANRVFLLSDCIPDVSQSATFLLSKAPQVLIKTSPLLDLKLGLQQLPCVKEIHVVAVENEVKELLWLLEASFLGETNICTVNMQKNHSQVFKFRLEDENIAVPTYSEPLKYLYEPNSAILKSGAFQLLSETLKIAKLHPNSHLYTSNKLFDFPGRSFEIKEILPFNKKSVKSLKLKKANITTRNFPNSVPEIRRKFKIADGGEVYLFFTKTSDERLSVISCCRR